MCYFDDAGGARAWLLDRSSYGEWTSGSQLGVMEMRTSADLARTTLQLFALGILIASSFWIVQPFLVASIWATAIVVATWPALLHVQAWLGGRRSLAVAVMTVALLLVLVVPLYFGIGAIVGNAKEISGWSKSLATLTIPQPPEWVKELPVVGAKLAAGWQQVAVGGPGELGERLSPFVDKLVLWFVGQVGSIGLLLLQFLLTVAVAAILYAKGEPAARGADLFARRLAGSQGEKAVHLAAQAIRVWRSAWSSRRFSSPGWPASGWRSSACPS